MLSTTASQATSLFQYIDDQRSNAQFVSDMQNLGAKNSAQDVDAIQNSLVNVQSIDNMVDQIISGESSVTGDKVNDMLDFYFKQVKNELKSVTEDLNLSNIPPLQLSDGKWQLASEQADNKSLNKLVDYLNRDSRLSERMEKVMMLSELSEQVTARDYAQSLKNDDTSDKDIEAYLLKTSEQLQQNRFLSVESGNLKLGNYGIAKEEYQERFGKQADAT
ncbi:hypothetical protein [Planctobacterium marinum]|uniref:hypothetical protein n=1 Tax=Planctobacterium marinum TaxID=1631968 RepID=UPI001E2BBB4F|nr:hypothetical protein [Planctobacterium marinum]MCC2604599.1 hypothetical protein [Planctobacterium marinum]